MSELNEQEFYQNYILPVFNINVSNIEWQHNYRVVNQGPYGFYEKDVFRNDMGDWALLHTFEYQEPGIVAEACGEVNYPLNRFSTPSVLDISRPYTYYFDGKASDTDYPSAYYYLLHLSTSEELNKQSVKEDAAFAEWEKQDKEFEENYGDLL